jgi:hypothetical protein
MFVFGDSFCANPEAWPSHLAQQLGCTVQVKGHPGASWWRIRTELLAAMQADPAIQDRCDLVIAIHTGNRRIPTNKLLGSEREQQQAVDLYYKHIYDDSYDIWSHQHWFRELAELFPGSRMINLFTGDMWPEALSELSSQVVPTPLRDLAIIQHKNQDIKYFIDDGFHGFLNHFTAENNIVFADQLYRIITEQQQDFDITKFKAYND